MSQPKHISEVLHQLVLGNPNDPYAQILRHCPFMQIELLKEGYMTLDGLTPEERNVSATTSTWRTCPMTKEYLLSKTLYGVDIIQHLIRKEFPDFVMRISGIDCGQCPAPVWADGSIIEVTMDRIPSASLTTRHVSTTLTASCSTAMPSPSPGPSSPSGNANSARILMPPSPA
mgnify:CR=1 FL=1